jgi:hypothetical protein
VCSGFAGEERIVAIGDRTPCDSEQNIGRSFWFALEHYVTNYTYFADGVTTPLKPIANKGLTDLW